MSVLDFVSSFSRAFSCALKSAVFFKVHPSQAKINKIFKNFLPEVCFIYEKLNVINVYVQVRESTDLKKKEVK